MYIERTLSKAIIAASEFFKVILLTGARQVGKTTLLQNIQQARPRSYISLDDFNAREIAENDPAIFIDRLDLPVLIDEIQYAPKLFTYIKIAVDRSKKYGEFWLTGSQQFSMMQNISDSLAGRVAIFNLYGLSLAETEQRADNIPFLPDIATLKQRQKTARAIPLKEMYHKIWRGSYPDLIANDGKTWDRFYASYLATYIERDIRDYLKISNLLAFRKFIQVAAARTGQMLNYHNIAVDVGVSEPTIKAWFEVLRASGIIYILHPYHNNITKRLLKTSKFYFLDTGLCCFLTGWVNANVLECGAMAGAMLETYVVAEIIKSYAHNGTTPRLYFYADKEQREIDLLIEQNGVLYPIEIKKSALIQNMHFKGFDYLSALKTPIGHG